MLWKKDNGDHCYYYYYYYYYYHYYYYYYYYYYRYGVLIVIIEWDELRMLLHSLLHSFVEIFRVAFSPSNATALTVI